jgi:hypothetical protein
VLTPDPAGRIVVFAGPSLPASARMPDARLAWVGPARAGDGLRLWARAPDAVVLIDGVFDETPSIRHKELLMLLGAGVRVYGAASMGALRAAELNAFGMIGVGQIFRAFASGRLTGDDEVAVAHAPAELDWRPLSEPLVNVRATLIKAVRREALGVAHARALLETALDLFYRERTWSAVLAEGRRRPALSGCDLEGFGRWAVTGKVDLKMLDAREAVDLALAETGASFQVPPMPPATTFTAALAGQLAALGKPGPRITEDERGG